MIKVNLYKKNIADGQYDIKEKGCIIACLSWADADGELKQYSPFAYLALNPDEKAPSFTGRIGPRRSRACGQQPDFSEVKEEY